MSNMRSKSSLCPYNSSSFVSSFLVIAFLQTKLKHIILSSKCLRSHFHNFMLFYLSMASSSVSYASNAISNCSVRKLEFGSREIGNSQLKFPATDHSHLIDFRLSKKNHSSLKETTKIYCGPNRELKDHEEKRTLYANECGQEDPFTVLKHRFLNFKKENFLENRIQYETLSEGQAPKFMVIACADSRVCPSKILGFQPGEAFTVRNIANLVPPFQHGASETTAALEFAVNNLEVPNVLVVGHSRCGGINALMSGKDEEKSRSFIGNWVSIAKSARLSTKAAVGNLSFEKQCAHCEKESINGSLLNLLGYPWIEKRVSEGKLSLHGGYYDFVNCTFEKWTLVYREGLEGGSKYAINDRYFWS